MTRTYRSLILILFASSLFPLKLSVASGPYTFPPSKAPQFLKQLKSVDDRKREIAADRLTRIIPIEALSKYIPALHIALKDKVLAVRISMAQVLVQISFGDVKEEAIHVLIHVLRKPRSHIYREIDAGFLRVYQEFAAEYLGRFAINDPTVRKTLIEVLDSDLILVKRNAAKYLGTLGPDGKMAIPALTRMMKDPDPDVANWATDALSRIGLSEAVKALFNALTNNVFGFSQVNKRTQEYIEYVIKEKAHFDKSALPVLTRILERGNPHTRQLVAIALSRMGADAVGAIPTLTNVIMKSNETTALLAVRTLYDIRTPEAVDGLVQVMDHKNKNIRQRAIDMLEWIGPPAGKAIPSLILNIKQDKTSNAIFRIGKGGIAHINDIIKLLRNDDSKIRGRAAFALKVLGRDARYAIPDLIATLGDENSHTRDKAAEALQAIGEEAVEPLIESLRHENRYVYQRAPIILGEMKLKLEKVVPALIEALKDKKFSGSRHNVKYALNIIGTPKALNALK